MPMGRGGVHKVTKRIRLMKNEKFMSAGLVAKVQKIFTKKGAPMVFARIEDFSPQPIEVIVFNNTLAKTMALWEENKLVFIRGRMSWRNGEPKMICDGATELTQ